MTKVQVVIAILGSFTLVMAIFLGLVMWANWDLITRDWKEKLKDN